MSNLKNSDNNSEDSDDFFNDYKVEKKEQELNNDDYNSNKSSSNEDNLVREVLALNNNIKKCIISTNSDGEISNSSGEISSNNIEKSTSNMEKLTSITENSTSNTGSSNNSLENNSNTEHNSAIKSKYYDTTNSIFYNILPVFYKKYFSNQLLNLQDNTKLLSNTENENCNMIGNDTCGDDDVVEILPNEVEDNILKEQNLISTLIDDIFNHCSNNDHEFYDKEYYMRLLNGYKVIDNAEAELVDKCNIKYFRIHNNKLQLLSCLFIKHKEDSEKIVVAIKIPYFYCLCTRRLIFKKIELSDIIYLKDKHSLAY